MSGYRSLLVISSVLLLPGCALLNSIHREDDMNVEKGKLISVDAKQRFLIQTPAWPLSSSISGVGGAQDGRTSNDPSFRRPIFCAEPSPDAFSVYAAAFEGSQEAAKSSSIAIGASSSETGATIGLRTESIQLLRDAMYRVCEAAAGGVLRPETAEDLHAKYQKSMVALIAIQQLTGAVTPPPVVIKTSASTGSAETRASAYTRVEEKRAAVKKQISVVDEAKKNRDALVGNKIADADLVKCQEAISNNAAVDKIQGCADYKVADAEFDEANKKLNMEKQYLSEAEALYADVSGSTTFASGSAELGSITSRNNLNKDSIQAIGAAVTGIVAQVFMDDRLKNCAAISGSSLEQALNARVIKDALRRLTSKKSIKVSDIRKEVEKLSGYQDIAELAEFEEISSKLNNADESATVAISDIKGPADALLKRVEHQTSVFQSCMQLSLDSIAAGRPSS